MRAWVIAAVVGVFIASIAVGATMFRTSPPVTTVVNAVEQAVAPSPQRLFGKDRLRVLVVGLDYDYDRLDQPTSKSSRSDVIMAVDIDFRNHRINELSIPRDMIATLPNGQKAKINQAQSDGGIAEAKTVIADWMGIPSFDRYVVLRINTSKDIINAVGGIDVDVKNSDALKKTGPNGPIDYDDSWGHLHTHLKPGLQHLDGERAVGYARFRHDWCSDPCRIMRQQQVLHAIVDKIEHDRLNTLLSAQKLLAVVRKDVDTDFTTTEQVASVVALAHLAPRDIHTAQVPYVASVILPTYGDSLVPDETAKQRLVASMFPDAFASAGVAAAGLRVRIENGTAVPGLAARFAVDLRREGFRVDTIANAATHDVVTTRIETASSDPSLPSRIRKALGGTGAIVVPATTSAGSDGPDVTIVLGRDVVGGRQ